MSTIDFKCGSCGHQYKVPFSAAGRKAKCKACGAGMQVPVPGGQVDEEIELIEVEPPVPTAPPARRASSSQRPAPRSPQRPAAKQPAPAQRPAPAKRAPVDLAALYAAEEAEAEEESPLDALASASGAAFDLGESSGAPRARASSRAKGKKKGKGGPPIGLLVGIGGGSALVLVIVVVLVVVLGGGEDEPEKTAGIKIAEKPTPSVANRPSNPASLSPRTPDRPEVEDEVESPVDDEPEEVLPDFVDLPKNDEGLVDWTIRVDSAVAEAARQVQRAGVVFTAPTSWIERSKPVEADGPQISDTVALSPDEKVQVSVIVGKYSTTRPKDWPTLMTIAQKPEDFSQDELILGKAVPFRGPHEFRLVPEYLKEPVSFGTLFGGYRFTRFVLAGKLSDNREVQVVHYLGTVGSLYMHITITGEGAKESDLAEAEWIARSARLMTESGLTGYAKKAPLFSDWLKDRSTTVPRLGDLPPVASATPTDWPGFSEDSDFKVMLSMAGAAGPIRSPYRIAPPAGLEPAASSRRAVRWQPNEQGLWMAMEVVDLGSRWRRIKSPLLGSDRAMIAGREMALPAGTETSEIEVNGMKVYRILPPASPAMDSREVYYITLDRGVLVTVLGRYAKDRPEDLAQLDAAARTFSKS